MEFLREEGYSPRFDDDGDVAFKLEGRNYFIVLDDDDETFFRILFPGFWPIENAVERTKAERAALTATADVKVAKVLIINDSAWATIEAFSSSPENSKQTFRRSINALQTAVRCFVNEMNS